MKKIFKLFICLIVCLFFTTLNDEKKINANTSEPSLNIVTYNVSYSDSIYLLVAGTSSNVKDKENIKMLFWNELQDEYTIDTANYVSEYKGIQTVKGYECQIYYSNGISAKELNDNIYFCSYVVVDGIEYYSSVCKYSVVNYVYDRLQSTVSTEQELVYNNLLNYGASTQILFDYNIEHLANETYYKVEVVNGILEDGFAYGLYEENQSAFLTANTSEYEFLYWINSKKEIVSENPTFELSVKSADVYTAVYNDSDAVTLKYSLVLDEPYDATADTLDLPTTVEVLNNSGETLFVEVEWDIENYVNNQIGTQTLEGKLVDSNYELDSALYITLNVLPYTIELNNETDKYSLVKYYGNDETVEIPTIYRGKDITQIKSACFDTVVSMKKLIIPSKIELIDAAAIKSCDSLNTIEIPFVGGSREANQFFGYIFGATSYSSQNSFIPKTLTEVIISEGLTELPGYSFYYCNNILDITLPKSLETTGKNIFVSSKLNNVYYNGTIEDWCQILFSDIYANPMHSASNFYIRNNNNVYAEVTSLIIPDSITEIGSYQFRGFTNVTSVTISDNVTYIGNQAFQNCTNLSVITLSKNLSVIGENTGNNVFSSCSKISKVFYNGSLEDWFGVTINGNNNTPMNAGKYFYYKDSNGNYVELTSLEVPNFITSIGKYQFYGFDHLKSVVIGSHVETIGIYAFNFCTSLSEITIKEGLKNINNGAFSDCTAIKQITLPNSLETLGERVFYNCSGLTSIVIPNKITTIKGYTFYKCTSLTSIVLPKGIVSIEQYGTAMSNNIANIYYMGSEEQWNEVVIGSANPSFSTATIHYNYVVE